MCKALTARLSCTGTHYRKLGTQIVVVSFKILILFPSFTDKGWEDRWVKSSFKSSDEGPWKWTAGKFYGDPDNKGKPGFLHSFSVCRIPILCILLVVL